MGDEKKKLTGNEGYYGVRGLLADSGDGGNQEATILWDSGSGDALGGHSRQAMVGASDGSEGATGGASFSGGKFGGKVNLADAERARAEAIAARKAAMVHPANRQGLAGTRASDAGGYRPLQQKAMTPAELHAMANAMLDNTAAQSKALSGSSLSQRDAAGSQVPSWLAGYMDEEDKKL